MILFVRLVGDYIKCQKALSIHTQHNCRVCSMDPPNTLSRCGAWTTITLATLRGPEKYKSDDAKSRL